MSRFNASDVWEPGWPGTMVVGAVAAVVLYCLYGPMTTENLSADMKCKVQVAQVAGSILVGMSGSQFLTSMAQRRTEDAIRKDLAATVQNLTETEE